MRAPDPSLPAAGARVSRNALEGHAARILEAAGVRAAEAKRMAACLVYAQASGVDSHGLVHLPHYVEGIAEGTVRPRPNFQFIGVKSGAVALDADDGLGVLAALAATDRAIQLAESVGVGAVAVRRSGHFGMASAYVDRIASRGMVGLVMSNASPTVALRGAKRPALGTNPIAAGFPRANGAPVILDIATTTGSRARIRAAQAAGEAIPDSWALDETGVPTSDPAAALRGTMQALGGDKGTVISLLVELLCVALSGGMPGTEVRPPQDRSGRPAGVSHLVVAFEPAAFVGREELLAKVDEIASGLEAVPPKDAAPVRMPGSRAAAERDRTDREGIHITSEIAEALRRAEAVVSGLDATA